MEKVFAVVRETPSIMPASVERLMGLVADECAWVDEVQVARTGRYFDVDGPAPADFESIRFETEAYDFRQALARTGIEPVREQVSPYADRLGLTLKPDSLDERIIGRAVLRGFAEASELAAARVRAEMLPCEEAIDPS